MRRLLQTPGANRMKFQLQDSEAMQLLELATSADEDEFGNVSYVFETPTARVELNRCVLDGDTSVCLVAKGQSLPLVKLDLVGCAGIRAVNDKRGKYLELIGQLKEEPYSRGDMKQTFGFRLRLEPTTCLEPFYCASSK